MQVDHQEGRTNKNAILEGARDWYFSTTLFTFCLSASSACGGTENVLQFLNVPLHKPVYSNLLHYSRSTNLCMVNYFKNNR